MDEGQRRRPRIAIVLTSHAELGNTGKKTGFYFEEMSTPYYIFKEAGIEVELASIQGGEPPYDPASMADDADQRPESVNRFLNDADAMAALKATKPVGDLNPEDYDAVFLPGGHGTMWDMADNETLGRFVGTIEHHKGVVGAVCHGPAGLLPAIDELGRQLLPNRRVNGFTNEEERQMELDSVVPFLLEDRLRDAGATFQAEDPFQPEVVTDERLVTGQNPASSAGVAEKMVKLMKQTGALKRAA